MAQERGFFSVNFDHMILAAVVAYRLRSAMNLLNEHWSFNDELLPHVYFGELVTWIESRLGDDDLDEDVLAVVDEIENSVRKRFALGLIDASFVEEFDWRNAALMASKLSRVAPLLHQKFAAVGSEA